MAAIVQELLLDGRQEHDGDKNGVSASRVYLVRNSDDETTAINAAISYGSIEGWKAIGAEIEERLSEKDWRIRVEFEPKEDEDPSLVPDDDPNNYTFDTGSGTMHRDVALEHVATYPDSAPSFGGAIGVDGDGGITGCDIVMPTPGFTETVTLSKGQFNAAYKRRLIYLTGKVNDAPFRGFESGEVLFNGASASRNGEKWTVTYRFSVSENKTDLVVGSGDDAITIAAKEGWDYLWFRYAEVDAMNGDGNVVGVVRKPVAAYVERVYERADFGEIKSEEE